MSSRTQNTRALGAIVIAYIIALALDLFVLPGHVLVSSLYAVPVLMAARGLPPRGVGVVALVSLVLTLLTAWLKSSPITIWPYGVLALIIIGYLSILLSRESRETKRRAAEAQEARRRLQEFTAMVAHDLRGPLTIILGYIQMLGKGRETIPPEVRDKAVNTLEGETRRMDRLIGDLLDAAKIGARQFTTERERVNLVEVARRGVEEQQATTNRHRIVLEAPVSLEGWWDPDRIVQVLTNLISNAVKYSPDGGEVRVNVTQVGDNAVVRVSDQGIGLAPEDIPLLFEPFSRLYREQPVKWTGLGLYITRAIIEAHGGRIWAESRGRGKGSTFVFTLPVSRGPEKG